MASEAKAEGKAVKRIQIPEMHDVAAGLSSIPMDRLLEALETFKTVEKAPESEVLKGNRQPAMVKMSSPAYIRTNAESRRCFVSAAEAHKLQSPRFDALLVKFSDPLQALLCVPVSWYDEANPDHAQVTWSPDGMEMRCDLAYILTPKQWAVPQRMVRWVDVGLYPDLPGYGTVVVLDLKNSTLEPVGKKEPASKEQEPTAKEPEPVAKEPEPITKQPAPVTTGAES